MTKQPTKWLNRTVMAKKCNSKKVMAKKGQQKLLRNNKKIQQREKKNIL